MKKTFLTFLFCSVVLMFGNQLHASVDVDFINYLPLHVGNSWTLVDEFSTTYNYQVIGTECIAGKKTYQYRNWEGNPNYANLTHDNGMLVIAGLDGTALNPPRIYDGKDIDNPYVHIVYESVPSVTTPAGIFFDIIKETIYAKKEGQEIISRVQYFANGVGLVKDENWCSDCGGTYTFTALLTSHVVAGSPLTDLGTCISLPPINFLLLKNWTCKADDVTKGIYRVCNYFPITLGDQWTYTTGDRTIRGPEQTCSTGYCGMIYGTTTYEYEPILQNEKNGLMIPGCKYERPSGDFSDFGETIVLIKPEMQIGEIVNSQHPNLGWSFSTTLIGFESVTVPSGTYNALKFEIVTNHTDGSCSYKTTLWLAKDIGPVKIHRTDANPADCNGCMFVCPLPDDLVLLNTPAELTSFSVND